MRYYAEYQDAGKRVPTGNVVACDGYGAYMATFHHPNSAVYYGSVQPSYLGRYCRLIPEAEARKIHPRLFERIESDRKQDDLARYGDRG